MPPRLRPASTDEVDAALAALRAAESLGAEPAREDVRLLVKHYLALLAERAPGRSVEVRVAPYAAVQCVAGTRHVRGTPPAIVESDAMTWIALATGARSWAEAVEAGDVRPSGERSDLTPYLPVA